MKLPKFKKIKMIIKGQEVQISYKTKEDLQIAINRMLKGNI